MLVPILKALMQGHPCPCASSRCKTPESWVMGGGLVGVRSCTEEPQQATDHTGLTAMGGLRQPKAASTDAVEAPLEDHKRVGRAHLVSSMARLEEL